MFFAQIGPTGGDNGYSAITNHVGWGISWWVGSITVRRQDFKSCQKRKGWNIWKNIGKILRYINGLLIPEIYVVRGKTYTFVVEGGDDKVRQPCLHFALNDLQKFDLQKFAAGYHPFYITDDPEGGYEFKSPQERRKVH